MSSSSLYMCVVACSFRIIASLVDVQTDSLYLYILESQVKERYSVTSSLVKIDGPRHRSQAFKNRASLS
jgi:hypothetical protein